MYMTGAEVIIKKGRWVCLGKVRHTGYDVKDFFKKSVFKTKPEELWDKYLKWRRKDYNETSLLSEIITDYDSGFSTVFSKNIKVNTVDDFYNLKTQIEDLIRSASVSDGYLYGYGDYLVFVDYNKKEIQMFV